jgi:mannose-1-phosphate guanylyltransferase / mannose-6-phosphate isomerase
MERTDAAAVVPTSFTWSDVGSWQSLWDVSEKNADGNVLRGDVFADGVRGSYIRAEQRFVAVLGVEDLVVVETPDAVLVARHDASQDVRKIVAFLDQQQRAEHQFHQRVHRPWGWYEEIDAGHRFVVKRIMVKPGAAISLQLHHHRAEHWVVVNGTARVRRGDEVLVLSENESTYIPVGTVHRLENPGKIPLHIVEVQSGGYLAEDDIVRLEDRYGREEKSQETVK